MSIAAICRPEVIAIDAGASLRDFGVISVMGESGASNAVAEVTRLIGRPPLMNAAFKSREVADGSCRGAAAGVRQSRAAGQRQFALRSPVHAVAASRVGRFGSAWRRRCAASCVARPSQRKGMT